MSDPISSSQARVAHSVAANRTTLEKLDKKPVANKPEQPIEAKAPAKPQGAVSVILSNLK